MLRAAAILAALLAAPAALAQGWTALPSDPALQLEFDPGRLHTVDGHLSGWLMLSWLDEQPGRVRPWRSAVVHVALDCERRRYAIIQGTSYSGPRGSGEVVDRFDAAPEDWQWQPADAAADARRMLDAACGG